MEKKSKNRGSSKSLKPGASFEQELGPLVKAIDDAVQIIPDKQQRLEVRQSVTEAVHGAVRQLAVRSDVVRPADYTTSNATINAGMSAIKEVQNLGFVEFTAGLINGTFDAIIGATVKQMEAYSKLVADLAKTLADFKADNVTDAQITAHLAARYPDGVGGTSVRSNFTFTDTPADPVAGTPAKLAHDKLVEVSKALIQETKSNKVPLKFDGANEIVAGATSFTTAQVDLVRLAIGEMLAISMIEHLRAMAREGMARIVITNGELLSKLTFKVTATSEQETQRSRYQETELNANVRGGFGGKSWGVKFSASYNNLNVSTVNESTHDKVTMDAEIIGMVKLNFRTESYPPIVTDGPIG
ncbi:MAG TPA: hypothetical protein VEY88_03910 [Archangium sp.]|nr:hypothetical protein [Archangium sp.]